jgi:hypothetical protein
MSGGLFLDLNTGPALVAGKRNHVIEIRNVDRATFGAGGLLYALFDVGFGSCGTQNFESNRGLTPKT